MFLADAGFSVADSLTTATTVIRAVLGWITDNPVLTACFVLGTLVPAGITAFRHLKNSAN